VNTEDSLFLMFCSGNAGKLIPVHVGPGVIARSVCKNPFPLDIQKSQFPLKTRGRSYNPHLGIASEVAVRAAITWVNSSAGAGFDAMEWYDGPETADVEVRLGVARGSWGLDSIGANGAAYHWRHVDGRVYAEVVTSNTGSVEALHLTLCHEFLHVLGLAHVDWRGSIMFPVVEESETGAFHVPWLGDAQRRALQLKYDRRKRR
jgi:hypothetical protein